MVDAERVTNRLKAFFASWAAARAGDCASTLADRLTCFFEQSRSLLTLPAPPEFEVPGTLTNQLDLKTLEATLQLLRSPLMKARSTGAFFNVWSTAGLKRDEGPNAAVFAALLDPRTCPGTGPEFLWAFLQRARRSPADPLPNEAEVRGGYTLRTEDYPLGYADNRVDLSIEGRNFLLIIEVKIDAGEGLAQLKRYDGVLQAKAKLLGKRPALVYLSPRPPENPPPGTVYAKWTDVVFAARQVGRAFKAGDHSLVSALLLHFAAHASAFT
jgi:hypothetical protein